MRTPLFYEVELRTDDELIENIQFRHKEPFVARTKAIQQLNKAIDQALYDYSNHFYSLIWTYDKGNDKTRQLLFCSAVLSKKVRDRMEGFNRVQYLNKDAWPISFEREYRFYKENGLRYFGWEEVICDWDIARDCEILFSALPQSGMLMELVGFPVRKGNALHGRDF